MPLTRTEIRLRASGVVELEDQALIRFGTVEPHQVIKSALAAADLYRPVLDAMSLPPQAVLAVSCFALVEGWTPQRLAMGTRYANYYTIEARTIFERGYELWPTETFTNGVPDPNNPVHFDIVVVRGLALSDIADRTGSPAQRRHLRSGLLSDFTRLLEQQRGPHPLFERP